jgi:hypothetical protein
VGEQANGAFGWGQQFQLGTNLNDTTLQDAINNSHVFHFAPSIPSAISNLENDSDSYSREDNVIMFPSAPAIPQQTILGSVGVSVGVIALGSSAEGGQNAGGGGSVLFTYLGVYLGFDDLEIFVNPKVARPSVAK